MFGVRISTPTYNNILFTSIELLTETSKSFLIQPNQTTLVHLLFYGSGELNIKTKSNHTLKTI